MCIVVVAHAVSATLSSQEAICNRQDELDQKREKEVRRASTSTMQDWGTTLRWAPIRRTPSSLREPPLLERAEKEKKTIFVSV